VQANIVSPILVVLVAVTGLASFSIPSYSLAFAVRIYRFFYILMGATLGFYGIAIGLFVQIMLTVNLKSFGVPYLSPTGPRTYGGPDTVYRGPLFLHRRRPDYLNAQDDLRMPRQPRGWLKGGGGGEGAG
jgi:spore germination protein KA